MTKTLLINCYLKPEDIASLQKVLQKHSQVTTLPYGEIREGYQIEVFDAVVVSGSAARIVNDEDKTRFACVSELLKTCEVPVLGICFGHQLLCSTFNAKVGSLAQPVIDRFKMVHIIRACELFDGFSENQIIPFFQHHNDYVLKEGLKEADFILLADSGTCEVEAVKHKTKPFFGCQFHPEDFEAQGETNLEGHKLIENFYRIIG